MARSSSLAATSYTRGRAALGRGHNWVQLGKFCTIGAIGYCVNLAVYVLALDVVGLPYLLAAVVSFLVAVTNNYWWNRVWTFRGTRGHIAADGARFFVVSTLALGANLVVLQVLVAVGLGQIVAQAIAIVVVTPLNFVGNKLWSFRRRG